MTETWFRFDDPWAEGDAPFLTELIVSRHTAQCVVFGAPPHERFVLKDPRGKRYAYPTKELALKSYIIRKQRQMQHADNTRNRASLNLTTALMIERGEAVPAKEGFKFS